MWRIIEILKYFQYSCSVNIPFLMQKFNVTFRTLQRNVAFINKLLMKISNCNIVRKHEQFVINGDNEIIAINTLLAQFIHTPNEYPFVTMSNLFLMFVWQKKHLTSKWLINNISNTNKHNLKKDIVYLNNFLANQNLRLKVKFEHNKGFRLVGYEQHLRFITAIIIIERIGKDENLFLTDDKVLTYIYKKIKIIMINIGYKKYYDEQLIWFLTINVRRIKLNFFLEKNNEIEFSLSLNVKKEIKEFILIIAKEFDIKFDQFETNYFNFVCLLNIKVDIQLFPNITSEIDNITQKIFSFITCQYQVPLYWNVFKSILNSFLSDNWFKLQFNYYRDISFDLEDLFKIESDYQWGQQLLFIINSQLKNDYFPNLNLLRNKFLMTTFHKSFIENENWNIPLCIFLIDDSYAKVQINSFIKVNFSNILIISQKNNLNNSFKLHLLNQKPCILIEKVNIYNNYHLDKYKNITVIIINENSWNYRLEKNINEKIKWVMLKRIQHLITVFNFYLQEKFYSIKSILWAFQKIFMKKYNLNLEFLDIDECSIIKNYIYEKILLINQLIPVPNYNFPIILLYTKIPLIFHNKFKINFIFILFTNKSNTQNYNWIHLWISLFKKMINTNIKSISHIYKIIQSIITI